MWRIERESQRRAPVDFRISSEEISLRMVLVSEKSTIIVHSNSGVSTCNIFSTFESH